MMERVLDGGMCATKQRQRTEGEGELFAKQMVRRGSKWQQQPRTRLISSFWISRLRLLELDAPRCLVGNKLSDTRK